MRKFLLSTAVAAVICVFILGICPDWVQVHPSLPELRRALGHAPYWTSRFEGVPGARVDWPGTGLEMVLALGIAVVAWFGKKAWD